LNRAIGKDNKLPWHIPEDLRWFKKLTTGNVIIMGRKTWDSIGKPLPNRESIVLTRSPQILPGVKTIHSLGELKPENDPRDYFIIGGAQLFELALPQCSDLFLTVVKREIEGDVYLPRFEEDFRLAETIQDTAEFSILHYKRLGV
ncbi:MAG TPA: dihydrofolate reductase, partial [Verrucomicrobiae bacterium]|nr:dihydrofolate reductase [Verrucomicrobiae bacterium]